MVRQSVPRAPLQPQPVSSNWMNTLGSYAQQYGPHVLPGLLSSLGGGLGAYNTQQQFAQQNQQNQPTPNPQQPQQPQVPTTGITQQLQNIANQPLQSPVTPATTGVPTPQQQVMPTIEQQSPENPQIQLSDLLSHLISHRVDSMSGMMQTYPDRLFSQAVAASDSQSGSPQGPPRYTPTGPQFAFDQTLGGNSPYSQLSALGDFTPPQENKQWWRTVGNQAGGLLGSLAPLAGTYGGLPGILGGAALGGLGYGLKQL